MKAPPLPADFIYSRDCKLNLRKNVDTTIFSGCRKTNGEKGKNMKRIQSLHFLRGFVTVLVLLAHVNGSSGVRYSTILHGSLVGLVWIFSLYLAVS